MKIFGFMKGHGINFLIALVLLFAQANCELTLPGLMSDIVDVGISQGGIASPVPDKITQDDLDHVELFLDVHEIERVEAAYTAPDEQGVRAFTGDEQTRSDLAGFLGEAETLAYQFEQGIPVDEWAAGESSENVEALMEALGDTVDLKEFEAAASAFSEAEGHGPVTFGPGSLYSMREALVQELGADGDSIITSRAVAFVASAYKDAGVDVAQVQASYLMSQGASMLACALFAALCAVLAAFNASKTSAAIARDLRHDLYKRVLDFSPAEMVDAGTPVVTLLDVNGMEVEVDVPSSIYERRNSLSRITCRALTTSGESYPMKLLSLTPKADATQLYRMRLGFERQPDQALTAGLNMEAELLFTGGDSSRLFALPLRALFQAEGESYVWAVGPDSIIYKVGVQVEGGLDAEGRALVSGLKGDEALVRAGVHALREGEKVRPIPEHTKTNVGGLL